MYFSTLVRRVPASQKLGSLVQPVSRTLGATHNDLARGFSGSKPSCITRRHFAQVKGKEAWDRRLARIEALKVRRKGVDRFEKKRAFREFFDQQCKFMAILDRRGRQANMPFLIRVFAVVERLPIVMREVEEWEQDMDDLQAYLACFRKVYPEGNPFMPPESENPEDDFMTDEELWASLPPGFEPMPRITADDESGNVKTTNRQLDRRVYLTIQDPADDKNRWTYPNAVVKEDETMLAACQRALKTSIGADLTVWCPSNAPMGVQMKPYNEEQKTASGYFGEKLFFYKIQYDDGDVEACLKQHKNAKLAAKDFAWFSRGEAVERFQNDWGPLAGKFQYYFL